MNEIRTQLKFSPERERACRAVKRHRVYVRY